MNLCKYKGSCGKVQYMGLDTIIEVSTIIISLFALIFLTGIFLLFMYALFFGGPYAPVADNRIRTMIKLLKLKKGDKMADLGSGDGRIVIAFAQLGVESHGYEINPVLVAWSRYKIRRAGLEKLAFIHFSDYWQQNFSKFKAVTLFTSPLVIGRVGRKMKRELKPGSMLVSNSFRFPGVKHIREENKVFLYKF